MYVFGDALSTTTNNSYGLSGSEVKDYYGGRYSNGRVWVEVLAQRLGIGISNNWSYYGCGSSNIYLNVSNFPIAPSVASNAVVVVWGNNADLFNQLVNSQATTSQASWTAAINAGQTYELSIIKTLNSEGVRTLIMPSVVDISEVPYFSQSYVASYLQLLHANSVAYNTVFSNTLNQARAAYPGLTIYEPNFFALLNNVLTNASAYGLIDALTNGLPEDAMDALGKNVNTNGLGSNYIYWDELDPTAKLHEIMADLAMQAVAPVGIDGLNISYNANTPSNTINQIIVTNMPVGLSGYVENVFSGATNSVWATVTNFTATTPTQSLYVISPLLPPFIGPSGFGSINPNTPGSGSSSSTGTSTNSISVGEMEAYQLRLPYSWQWP